MNAGVLSSNGATPTLQGILSQGSGGSLSNGLRNTGTGSTVQIDAATLEGGSAAVGNISASAVRLGASKLIGSFNGPGGGVVTCVGAYNGTSYAALNAICQ